MKFRFYTSGSDYEIIEANDYSEALDNVLVLRYCKDSNRYKTQIAHTLTDKEKYDIILRWGWFLGKD